VRGRWPESDSRAPSVALAAASVAAAALKEAGRPAALVSAADSEVSSDAARAGGPARQDCRWRPER
jgi:hypothetical protein